MESCGTDTVCMKHFTNNCNATHLVDWKQMNCAACAEWQKLSADNMQ